MKYFIWTLGCQMNKSDAERIISVLENLGYKLVSKESEADLILVVACSVRQSAIDRIYGKAQEWQKIKEKRPLITILSGCVLDADKPKLEKYFDIIFEVSDLPKLPKILSKKLSNLTTYKTNNYFKIHPNYQSSFQAYIPISTGCNNFCSYCVVPYTRGREVSRPADEIIVEVRNLIAKDYKEITLLGQNVNSYGVRRQTTDYGLQKKTTFSELLRKINDIPGDFWIRLLTSHPKDMSDELIKTIVECKKVTEYIHLPVQSGDNEILKRMNRGYTIRDYLSKIRFIREKLPNVEISTDIIVGFPGETKKQFENTAKLMEEVKFDMAYIAQYSPRSGTAAAKLKDSVLKAEKKCREKVLTKILEKTAYQNNKKYLGREVEILVEGNKGDKSGRSNNAELIGKTRTFKNVKFKSKKNLVGQFVKVKITDCNPWGLKGKLVK